MRGIQAACYIWSSVSCFRDKYNYYYNYYDIVEHACNVQHSFLMLSARSTVTIPWCKLQISFYFSFLKQFSSFTQFYFRWVKTNEHSSPDKRKNNFSSRWIMTPKRPLWHVSNILLLLTWSILLYIINCNPSFNSKTACERPLLTWGSLAPQLLTWGFLSLKRVLKNLIRLCASCHCVGLKCSKKSG